LAALTLVPWTVQQQIEMISFLVAVLSQINSYNYSSVAGVWFFNLKVYYLYRIVRYQSVAEVSCSNITGVKLVMHIESQDYLFICFFGYAGSGAE
jgi:hypothetical protein